MAAGVFARRRRGEALSQPGMNAPVPNPRIPATRQPIFNLPTVVAGLIALLLAIHAGREYILSSDTDLQVILNFAFIPIRETNPGKYSDLLAIGDGARVWTFLTYGFLHAGWAHVILNVVWLAAFGSPLARRFGATRFLAYSAVGAIAGAALHLAIYPSSEAPVVGASAAISAMMAGAARFVFQSRGPMWSLAGFEAYRQPAAPLRELVRDGRVMTFLAVWFGTNIVFGFTGGAGLASGAVAWDAHLGGFVAGLLLFPLFDPVARRR
jgi:membrane associated rhomboid family serine protease